MACFLFVGEAQEGFGFWRCGRPAGRRAEPAWPHVGGGRCPFIHTGRERRRQDHARSGSGRSSLRAWSRSRGPCDAALAAGAARQRRAHLHRPRQRRQFRECLPGRPPVAGGATADRALRRLEFPVPCERARALRAPRHAVRPAVRSAEPQCVGYRLSGCRRSARQPGERRGELQCLVRWNSGVRSGTVGRRGGSRHHRPFRTRDQAAPRAAELAVDVVLARRTPVGNRDRGERPD